MMGQMRRGGAASGPKMSDAEIYKQVTNYSGGYKPKPTAQPAGKTKTEVVTSKAFREVKMRPPGAVTKTLLTKGPAAAQKQSVAIALNKARQAGARIPKK